MAEAIATVHIELILIHPIREGNGRIARLLASLMALQAGWPSLNFSAWDTDTDAYFEAIRAGLTDQRPMTRCCQFYASRGPVTRHDAALDL